jgi:hypothetical protein
MEDLLPTVIALSSFLRGRLDQLTPATPMSLHGLTLLATLTFSITSKDKAKYYIQMAISISVIPRITVELMVSITKCKRMGLTHNMNVLITSSARRLAKVTNSDTSDTNYQPYIFTPGNIKTCINIT